MAMLRRRWLEGAACCFGAKLLRAQTLPDAYHSEIHGDPAYLTEPGWKPLLNGRDLSGWHGGSEGKSEWFTTPAARWNRIFSPTQLLANPGPGDRIVNGPKNKTVNLVSDAKFGSFALYLEFMTARASNSGVYLHGLYEVQIFDSYGFEGVPTKGDCGAIYEREDGSGGTPPLRNACRAPGEWQSCHIYFAAPRFDRSRKKSADARVVRVWLNNILVQEDVVLTGPTRSSLTIPEAAENPLMLQGDHSAIAFRNIYVRDMREF